MTNRVKELRTGRRIRQIDFAAAMGVNQSAVSNWETGRNEPDNNMLCKIADYFGVSVDYVIGRTDDPSPAPELPQEKYREILAGPGLRLLLDADANLTDEQLQEIVEFIEFKRRHENR